MKRISVPKLLVIGLLVIGLLLFVGLIAFVVVADSPSPSDATYLTIAVLLTALATCAIPAWRLKKRIGAQKFILLCGAVLFVLCGLFPPWLFVSYEGHTRSQGYSFILSTPRSARLDISRLAVEWLCIAVATGTVWLLMSKPEKATAQGKIQEAASQPLKTALNNGGSSTPAVENFTPKQSPRKRPPRIVVVDDEPMMLQVVEHGIRLWFKEATVLKFHEGNAAWQELLQTEPDLLITDWVHPGLTGADMFSRLAEKKTRYPILVTSGFAKENQLQDYVRQGLTVTLLSKPYTIEQFNRKLVILVGAKTYDGD